MNHGLTENTVARMQSGLAHFPQIEKAILYGSRALGTYRTGSDIDLTLCGSALNDSLLSQISQILDDLLLPYKMDLSLMASLTHPQLLDHIHRVGVVFYEKIPLPQQSATL